MKNRVYLLNIRSTFAMQTNLIEASYFDVEFGIKLASKQCVSLQFSTQTKSQKPSASKNQVSKSGLKVTRPAEILGLSAAEGRKPSEPPNQIWQVVSFLAFRWKVVKSLLISGQNNE